MKFLAIIEETFREARARKTLVAFFVVSTVLIIIALLIFHMDFVKNIATTQANTQGGANRRPNDPLAAIGITVLDVVWTIASFFIFFITIVVGVFATASFITSLMEKGNIDLLLSKPVPRWLYIIGRYSGAVIIMALEAIYLIVGLWLAAGLSFGSWNIQFLSSILFIILGFAGTYSLVVFLSVITRSTLTTIIAVFASYIVTGMLLPLGQFLDKLVNGDTGGGTFTTIAKVLRFIVPGGEIGRDMALAITGQTLEWTPILSALLLIVSYLAVSLFIFSKKEF